MLIDAAAHFPGLEMQRLVAQPDLAALLEEAQNQPQKGERAGDAAEEAPSSFRRRSAGSGPAPPDI